MIFDEAARYRKGVVVYKRTGLLVASVLDSLYPFDMPSNSTFTSAPNGIFPLAKYNLISIWVSTLIYGALFTAKEECLSDLIKQV